MSLASRVSLVATLTVGMTGVFLAGTAFAQNPHAAPPVASKTVQQPAPPTAGAQMMADMQADQKKLDEMVAAMNAAMGCEKMGKMAAAITELSARQSRMMMHMMEGGMMHMMEGGMMKKAEPAPAPQETPKAQPNEHSQHHPEF